MNKKIGNGTDEYEPGADYQQENPETNAGMEDAYEEEEEEEEEDDGGYEDPVDIIKDFGAHPLMERAQKALIQQLKDNQQRIGNELYDKEEEFKRLTQQREVLGVDLYNLQQQLAKLQISLENSHNEFNSILDAKLQEEELVKTLEGNNAEQKLQYDEYQKQKKKYSSELEALNETLRQIETYNNEVKGEIAMTRRATYKAEQSIQSLEKHKESQDIYVDRLTQQIKILGEQIGLHNGQIEAQRKETSEANLIFKDTTHELELIEHEKKQLMTQWKAALAGLSRRDEALAQATQTLLAAEAAVHDYDVELETMRRSIQKEQSKNETLVNSKERIENELSWVEENLNKIRLERESLHDRYTLLTKSLAQTDAESKKLENIAKTLTTDSESLLQNLQIITRQRQTLEEEITLETGSRSNISKATENLLRQQKKVLEAIHELENEGIGVENEIARTKVDSLNANMLNDQLKEKLGVEGKEFEEKEKLIEKYAVEIRQRHDEIEKKMYRVDRLNKKYDKMVEATGGEENLGPLENILKNLRREIEESGEGNKELEREWLKKQTEMVTISSSSNEIYERNNELKARLTVLTQQQLRVVKELNEVKSEVKTAVAANGDMQKDISKLNSLISMNTDTENLLQNENYVLEMESVEELKEMERESVGLERCVEEMKREKGKLLDEIMETERQALLWEKKIQLDKETKAALDPSIGQAETQEMEREIHRMELRLEALKREQERLVVEMERAIAKRSTIETRYSKTSTHSGGSGRGGGGGTSGTLGMSAGKTATGATGGVKGGTSGGAAGAAGGGGGGGELTQAGMKKRIQMLKKDARELTAESTHFSGAIEEKRAHFSELTSELERVTNEYNVLETSNRQIQTDINDLLYQKQLNLERLAYQQKFVKRLKEYSQSGIDVSLTLQTQRRLLAASQALDNVKEIIYDLKNSNPHLNEILERVLEMTNTTLSFQHKQEQQEQL
jgi:coiled-coil domain-containing protein 40